jgi:hypothetical protein
MYIYIKNLAVRKGSDVEQEPQGAKTFGLSHGSNKVSALALAPGSAAQIGPL